MNRKLRHHIIASRKWLHQSSLHIISFYYISFVLCKACLNINPLAHWNSNSLTCHWKGRTSCLIVKPCSCRRIKIKSDNIHKLEYTTVSLSSKGVWSKAITRISLKPDWYSISIVNKCSIPSVIYFHRRNHIVLVKV